MKREKGNLLPFEAYSQMKVRRKSDEILAEGIKNGDARVAGELMEMYQNTLFGYIYQLMLNYQAAEDIFQETWLKVIEKIEQFNPKYNFKNWLFTIARNLCLDSLRKIKKRRWKMSYFKENSFHLPNESEVEKEKIDKVLAALPLPFREVIILRFFYQCQIKEMAEMLRIRQGTVKSRLHKGLKAMKKIWDKESGYET